MAFDLAAIQEGLRKARLDGWLLYDFHVLSIYTLWVPIYGIEGLVKAMTAVASIFTAIALWPLLPKILKMPSPFELLQVRAALKEEETKNRDAAQLLRQVSDAQRAMRESMSACRASNPL